MLSVNIFRLRVLLLINNWYYLARHVCLLCIFIIIAFYYLCNWLLASNMCVSDYGKHSSSIMWDDWEELFIKVFWLFKSNIDQLNILYNCIMLTFPTYHSYLWYDLIWCYFRIDQTNCIAKEFVSLTLAAFYKKLKNFVFLTGYK